MAIEDDGVDSRNVALANLMLSSEMVAEAIATEVKSQAEPDVEDLSSDHVLLKEVGRYAAYGLETECLWRWDIYKDGSHVQTGAALSLESAKRSVDHVLAFYGVRDVTTTEKTTDTASNADES
ncbi:MAG: hypothetical protein HOP04_07845 [Methylophilaceae bacterium]|nr:hypothetical protein [Methylophilaceae bacterium]